MAEDIAPGGVRQGRGVVLETTNDSLIDKAELGLAKSGLQEIFFLYIETLTTKSLVMV